MQIGYIAPFMKLRICYANYEPEKSGTYVHHSYTVPTNFPCTILFLYVCYFVSLFLFARFFVSSFPYTFLPFVTLFFLPTFILK
jgi:hypothetical protein